MIKSRKQMFLVISIFELIIFIGGIKEEEPNQGTAFCIEGSDDGSTYASNFTQLNTIYWQYDSGTDLGCIDRGDDVLCFGALESSASDNGDVDIGYSTYNACSISGMYISCG